jgi:phospholipase/lecithinase/hemolysin
VAHPTPQGHRIVAEALADRLSERDAER